MPQANSGKYRTCASGLYFLDYPQHLIYCLKQNIVTYIPIARQRLGKHIPVGANARNNSKSIARQRIRKHV
jgi:hypothetical protein